MQDLFNNNLKREVKGYFDKTAHFYCEETILFHYIDEEGRNRLEYSEGVVAVSYTHLDVYKRQA